MVDSQVLTLVEWDQAARLSCMTATCFHHSLLHRRLFFSSLLVPRWTRWNLQDPTIFTESVVYVPTCRSLGVNFCIFGSLNTSWYMLAGIKFTSAHVSSLALKYRFLWWCGCNLYAKLVIRWVAFGTFCSLACFHFDLYLQAKWIFWSAVVIRVVIWGTSLCMPYACLQLMHLWLPILGISLLLLIAHTGKMTKLVASFTLIFLGRTLESL